ncbi:SMAD/FHA domain-containing protein [Forsythia ovata]|uniref:SMAD/FHA domain-containing protein n=1 Tax=Forsythia ovata TaxID=205694 RepID=A0ABD1PZI0_9LAMI
MDFNWFNQQTSISELKALLDEERDQRRDEREKSAIDLKASIQRVQVESEEEIKRISDAALGREREQQELINKLHEAEKERCSLVETLRSKLEDTRQKLVFSDNKVRQLEAQIREEQLAFASNRKKVEELEHERKRLRKELEHEKAAREEAWAKVSALELEINAAMRDLDFERRRLKGATERIMLRETQLWAFYSTTEEILVLFAKQQEQLKSMQRTIEDQENYETTSVDIDLNPNIVNVNGPVIRNKEVEYQSNNAGKAGSSTSTHRGGEVQVESSSDEASVTKKHDCNVKSQEDGEDTQEVEFTGAERNVKGDFGSYIDGSGTAPISEENAVGTEQIPETEGVGAVPILE